MNNNSEKAKFVNSAEAESGTMIYLVPPAVADLGGPRRTQDKSVTDQGKLGDAVRGIIGGRSEIKVDSGTVTNQIKNYVTVVHDVAESEAAKEGTMQLSEITLSLTISAEGNIGIASTSAEAGISLVFKRE